ncbi:MULTISPECIES: hypothetical protein [Sporosarcina]|uniref:Uncharacterized protein YegJ (DUF2314 family) n=2 Tax=Sporosarcina psychrophila TaxID=1476 RepID=A0ABV2KAR0_SPOPS|nr:hypothetical protein [Sporosarcina psychrophila]AMQ06598.1 hypothetical protein AZE41_12045 [Sporosarcina psychrophila]
MPLIPTEALPYFENMIYLPMIISILERDREVIEISSFKLKGPYINIIENTLKNVRAELKETNNYARSKNMKLIKKGKDGSFTEYAFIHNGYEDKRRYMNIRLRNRTEELINVYFAKSESPNLKG